MSDDRDTLLKRHVERCPLGWHKGQLRLHRATTDTDVIAWLQELERLVDIRQDVAMDTRLPKPPLPPEDEVR